MILPQEAETVRAIFTRYLELGAMVALIEDLDRRGISRALAYGQPAPGGQGVIEHGGRTRASHMATG